MDERTPGSTPLTLSSCNTVRRVPIDWGVMSARQRNARGDVERRITGYCGVCDLVVMDDVYHEHGMNIHGEDGDGADGGNSRVEGGDGDVGGRNGNRE